MAASEVFRSIVLFVLARLCEIGGGYLVWLWLRDRRSVVFGVLGARRRCRSPRICATSTCSATLRRIRSRAAATGIFASRYRPFPTRRFATGLGIAPRRITLRIRSLPRCDRPNVRPKT